MMKKYLVRANWLWDGILEAQSKHIKTEWSEAFQKRSFYLLDEESLFRSGAVTEEYLGRVGVNAVSED